MVGRKFRGVSLGPLPSRVFARWLRSQRVDPAPWFALPDGVLGGSVGLRVFQASSVPMSRRASGVALFFVALLMAPTLALAADPIRFDVVVAKVSTLGGDVVIDPGGAALHRALVEQFKYDRLEVVATTSFTLGIDEVGRTNLPNGRELLVKPLLVDAAGALVAVDVRGLLKTDLRMKNDHLVVIGAERFEGGKLIVSLEPHFEQP